MKINVTLDQSEIYEAVLHYARGRIGPEWKVADFYIFKQESDGDLAAEFECQPAKDK